MDFTVEKLPVGTRLRLGAYAVTGYAPEPIFWLKATPDGAFIAEEALDYIAFDARERRSSEVDHRYNGNPNYELSNILQYLNSEDDDWFYPTNSFDETPCQGNVCQYHGQYGDHAGFLYSFADYEIASLHGPVELPHYSDFFGDHPFPLFKRKGIRAKSTENLYHMKLSGEGFRETSYVDFWTQDQDEGYNRIKIVGRDGYQDRKCPYQSSGLRPVIKLDLNAKIMVDENGVFTLEPFVVQDDTPVFSEEDLYKYLGLNPA